MSLYCYQCGVARDEEAHFCSACGTHYVTETMTGGVTRDELKAELKAMRAELRLLIICAVVGVGFVQNLGTLPDLARLGMSIGVLGIGFFAKVLWIR